MVRYAIVLKSQDETKTARLGNTTNGNTFQFNWILEGGLPPLVLLEPLRGSLVLYELLLVPLSRAGTGIEKNVLALRTLSGSIFSTFFSASLAESRGHALK